MKNIKLLFTLVLMTITVLGTSCSDWLDDISPRHAIPQSALTDEQLDEFVRNHAETAFHPCGTCKMGYDEMSVVDGEGRVHGLEGLRVVDASIMPQIITGNLNATTIMIGEKIADMIRGQEALPRSTAGYFVANGMPVRAKK